MNPCELTASITALANIIAKDTDDNSLALLGAFFTQLGDSLNTIVASRNACRLPETK